MASRRPAAFQFEELEARLLYSADLAPLAMQLEMPALMAFTLPASDPAHVEQANASDVAQAPHEIVFVDSRVEDADLLLRGLAPQDRSIEVIHLDARSDGIDQISQALAGRHDIAAVHIVSHGSAATLQLGAATLDADTLARRAEQVARWGDALAGDADLLLYGCDVARGEAGARFVEDLALLTGADVAASDDATGHAARGGDWTLEVRAGAIATPLAASVQAQQDWLGVLPIYTVTNTADSGAGSLRQAIIDANTNGGLDTIAFDIGGGGAHTIAITTGTLPTITGPTIVDGRTQDGYTNAPLIEIDGAAAGSSVDGLRFSGTADGSEVYGLAIVNFDYDGIWLMPGADNITVRGNYLGIGLDGVTAKPNFGGLNVYSANNLIGGITAADRNVISGNTSYGISVANASGSGNVVLGNYIGTNAAGTAAVGNDVGVFVDGAPNNQVGGTAAGAGNVISGNRIDGIQLFSSGATNNTVAGNLIGLNAAGTAALGNTNQGVAILGGATNNTIGGTTAGSGNVISGNGGDGVRIEGATTTGNVIAGNTIGLNAAGTAAVANNVGVRAGVNAGANTIGGTAAGAGNLIASNTQQGVLVEATASGISILGNSIRDNGALGIDLGGAGVTANDAGDGDSGANTLQNFPVLASAFSVQGNTMVNGTLNSAASSTYRIELFSSPSADGSGYGEAATWLGFLNVTTNASGNATFSALLAGVSMLAGHRVTATATLLTGGTTPASTSEFAQTVAVNVAPVHTAPGAQVTPEDTTLVFSAANGNQITITDDTGASVQLVLSVDQGTLTLSQLTGLSITAGANGSSTMTVSGTVASLNAALNGLAYQPVADATGSATLRITSSDTTLASLNVDAALAARYTFDDPAALGADASGQGHTGTVIGPVAAVDAVRGDVLSLDGDRDRIHITGNLGNPSQVTLSAWVYADPTDAQGEVISLGDNVQLRVDHNGTRVSASFYDGVTFRKTESGDVMTTGAWHHITYVVDDAANLQSVYIDGALVVTSAHTGSITYTRGVDTFIGIHGNGNTNYDYKGLIDDARVFSRALTAAEVASLALTDTDRVAITVSAVNDDPAITTNGGGASAGVSVAENSTAVTTVAASDIDLPPQTLSYSIAGGADAARFAIDSVTGALSFVVAPDFESPSDAGGNNVYDVIVQASDGAGGSDTQAIAVTVTALNDNDPVITSNGGGASAAVNVAENSTAVTTVSATDADAPAQTMVYSIAGGADAARFTIDASTGALSFATAPDFESPADVGGDNVYNVTVQAADGAGRSDTQALAVTVTGVNDHSPVITSNGGGATAAVGVAENGTAVTTVSATDADAPAQTMVYSIAGGADAARFAIDASSGALSFAVAPDFESPADAGGNNVYDVIVEASDGAGGVDSQAIAVTVTAVNDNAPVITSNGGGASAAVSVAENTIAVATVAASDADVPAQTLAYSIAGGADASRFTIDASSGVLSFVAAPDFESPGDAGGNNVYDVIVQASDGAGGSDTQSIAVTVTAVNDNNPAITSAATANVAENSTAVMTVTATDADLPAQALVYSITGGVDAARFAIDGSTGALSFAGAPDFEAPADAGANNVYDVTVQVSDGAGGIATQAIAVTVTAVNDNAPVITSGVSATVAENATAVMTVTATDADLPAQSLTWSIAGGADAARFSIDAASGALSFVAAPDFEAPADAGSNNVYDVTVQASDGAGGIATRALAVTVTAVNDNAPVITSGATASVAENSTAVAVVGATDADLPAQTLTWSIAGGADAARFVIDASTGALSFAAAPDFESPTDAGGNNVYDVTVRASDGASSDTQSIAVTVTAVNDNNPAITSAATANVAENSTGVMTVIATDADAPAPMLTYAIAGGADAARFAIDAASGALSFVAAPDFESPADAGANNVYDVTVQASDGAGGIGTQSIAVTVTAANDNAPVITSSATASVAENSTAVTTVTATDADAPAQTLTYAIAGGTDAARFAIDASTGALSFAAAPDFESPTDTGGNNVYDVTVQASDGAGGIAMQSIAVTVTAVNDHSPVITSTAAVSVAENSSAVTTVTATDADAPAQTLTYSIAGGADAARFAIDAATGALSFVAAPDFEAPADAGANNVYDLTVQAADGAGGVATQAIAVTVTAVADNSPVITSTATPSVAENITAVTTVTATDADVPAQTLTYSIAGGADAARFTIDATTGALRFAVAPDFESPADTDGDNAYDVVVRATDSSGAAGTQAIRVAVVGVNDAPASTAIAPQTAFEDQPFSFRIPAGSITDPDAGDTLVYSASGGPAWLAFDAATGTFTGTPAQADAGVSTVIVRATDSAGLYTETSVIVNVLAVDDAPLAVDDAAVGDEDMPLTGNVLANDSDAEGDTLAAEVLTAPAHGQVTLDADGSFVYRPAADWSGSDSFTYRVVGGPASAQGQVTLQVQPVNDAPVVTLAHLWLDASAPATLDTSALDASDLDTDRASLTFEVGSIAGARIERTDAPGVAVDSFDIAELGGGRLRVVPTGGAMQIVLRSSDGETAGEWFELRIDTVPAAADLPAPTAPSPIAVPPAPPAEPAPQAPQAPSDETPPAGSATPPAGSPAGVLDIVPPLDLAPPASFAADRSVLSDPISPAHGASAAAQIAAGPADAGTSLAGDGTTTQLVVDLRLEVIQQRLAMPPLGGTGARVLAVGEAQAADAGGEPEMEDAAQRLAMGVEAIEVAGLSLTVGIIWWALRLAGVAGSLLVSLPAWGAIDPLPILGAPPDEDDDRDGAADPAADSSDEDAAAEVLSRRGDTQKAVRR